MGETPEVQIETVRDAESLAEVAAMFREYADGLGFALDFQDFDRELRTLPGDYAPPQGVLFLARVNGRGAGCGGLRPLETGTCEMKRLFVRASYRGQGIGRKLAFRLIEHARSMGYRRMRLDTVPSMKTALALYRSMGFVEIPPYRFNPVRGAVYLELRL
jgi:GNAT superfamily N-acetyltransferase